MGNVVAELSGNSIGTWKLNLERSSRTPPSANPAASYTMVFASIDEGVNCIVTGRLKDGTAIHFAGPMRYDGKEYQIEGAPWDTNSFTPVDAHTCTFEDRKAGGNFHVVGRLVISEDGRTMTIATGGIDSDGTPVCGVEVYEKE